MLITYPLSLLPSDEWDKYNWGTVHTAKDEDEAIKYLVGYSYDAIIFRQGVPYPKVWSHLIAEYPYDSIIVLQGDDPEAELPPDVIQVGQSGYIILPVDDLSLLLCNADKLIWETHGRTAHHK